MIGLVIAVIWGTLCIFVFGDGNEGAFLSSANFLFWWHIVWTVPWTIIMLVMSGIITFGTSAAVSEFGKFGLVGGLVAGGGLSILGIAIFSLNRVLLIGGSYLISTSDGGADQFSEFNMERLIWGLSCLLSEHSGQLVHLLQVQVTKNTHHRKPMQVCGGFSVERCSLNTLH